jgi:Fur family ferric uptake transcriptional regulator
MHETPATIAARLREHGLRVTSQRRAILAAFEGGASGHLTAEEVFERARDTLPELGRATVYNTLGELVRVGLLRTVDGLGAQRFDPNLDADHHHFHCVECGGLFDVRPRGADQVALAEHGFQVHSVQILLEGTCPDCAAV